MQSFVFCDCIATSVNYIASLWYTDYVVVFLVTNINNICSCVIICVIALVMIYFTLILSLILLMKCHSSRLVVHWREFVLNYRTWRCHQMLLC